MFKTRLVAALAVSAVVAGCEAEPLDPEVEGEIWVGVHGDGGAGPGASHSLMGSGSASADGSVAVRARVYLWTTAGRWEEVTRGAVQQTVRVDGSDGVQALASGEVRAGSYGRVRVEFEEVRASLTEEARIDLGLGTSELGVELGPDSRAVVERELTVGIRPGARTRVTVDLNADAWLPGADRTSRLVSEGLFESSVRLMAD